MANPITVPYTIMRDSGIQEGYDPSSGAWAEVVFKCRWEDHLQLVQDLVGTFILITATPPSVVAVFPFRYPGSPNLTAQSVTSVKPFGRPKIFNSGPFSLFPPNTWLVAELALVTCRFTFFGAFENAGQDASGKPYTATTIQFGGEVLTLPNTSLQFPDGSWNNTPFPINLPSATITQKRFMLPYLPIAQMFSILGGVNVGPWPLGNFICPPGTVLFNGGNTEFTLNADATVIQTVDYQFSYRLNPWNSALNPRSGNFELITNPVTGATPYTPVDFSVLP